MQHQSLPLTLKRAVLRLKSLASGEQVLRTLIVHVRDDFVAVVGSSSQAFGLLEIIVHFSSDEIKKKS